MGRIVSGLVVLLLLVILPKFLLRKWKYRRYVPVQARVDSVEKREERIDRDTVNSPEYWAKISFEWEGELRTCSWGPLSRSPEEGKEMGIRFDPSNGDWTPWEEESRLEKKKDLFVIFAAFFLGFSAVLVRFFDENVQISLPELWIPRLVCLLTGTGFLGSLAVWWGGYCSFRRSSGMGGYGRFPLCLWATDSTETRKMATGDLPSMSIGREEKSGRQKASGPAENFWNRVRALSSIGIFAAGV